ncbi:MAG: hypothetical protein ABSF29_04625 [Tepidisphaeraceae bacterium]|jgi:hypothetical protein
MPLRTRSNPLFPCAAAALLLHLPTFARAADFTSQSLLADALTASSGINDNRQRAIAMYSIAQAQAESGDLAAARQTAAAIPVNPTDADAQGEAAWKTDTYAVIAGGQAKAGDFPGAQATAESITDPQAKQDAYLNIAQSLAEKGDITDARVSATHTDGIDRDRANAAIAQALATAGDIPSAKTLAADLGAPEEQSLAFAAIAQAQIKSGDIPAARLSILAAKAAAANVPQYLSSTCYCAIASAEVKANDLDGATSLEKTGAAHITEAIAIAQAEMGDLTSARATLAQVSDTYEQVCVQASIAEAQIKSGDPASALQTLDAAKFAAATLTDSLPDAAARIAAAETKAGDTATAAQWAKSQQDPFVEVTALISIARAQNSNNLASGN